MRMGGLEAAICVHLHPLYGQRAAIRAGLETGRRHRSPRLAVDSLSPTAAFCTPPFAHRLHPFMLRLHSVYTPVYATVAQSVRLGREIARMEEVRTDGLEADICSLPYI